MGLYQCLRSFTRNCLLFMQLFIVHFFDKFLPVLRRSLYSSNPIVIANIIILSGTKSSFQTESRHCLVENH